MRLFYPNRYTGDPAAEPGLPAGPAMRGRLEDALAAAERGASVEASPPHGARRTGPSALGIYVSACCCAGWGQMEADFPGRCTRSGRLSSALLCCGADAGGATRRAERRAGRGAGRDDLFGTGGLTHVPFGLRHVQGRRRPVFHATPWGRWWPPRGSSTRCAPRPSTRGLKASLHGSLAFTGVGHATDRATILGLAGFDPATYDAAKAEAALAAIRETT